MARKFSYFNAMEVNQNEFNLDAVSMESDRKKNFHLDIVEPNASTKLDNLLNDTRIARNDRTQNRLSSNSIGANQSVEKGYVNRTDNNYEHLENYYENALTAEIGKEWLDKEQLLENSRTQKYAF